MTILLSLTQSLAIRLLLCAVITAGYNFYVSLRYGFEKRSELCDKLLVICFPAGCILGCLYLLLN